MLNEFHLTVREFVDGLLMGEQNAEIEKIIEELLKSYNNAVRSYRAESTKCDRLRSKIDQLKLSVKSADEV